MTTEAADKANDLPDMIELHAPGGVVITAPADGWEEGPGPDMQHCDNCGALEILSEYEQSKLCDPCRMWFAICDRQAQDDL